MLKITSLLLLLSLQVIAFDDGSRNFLTQKVEQIQFNESEGFITFWGGTRRWMKPSSLNGKVLNFPTKHTKTKIIPVYQNIHSKKAPLFIFFPGIYGSHKGRVSQSTVHEMEMTDAHTLVIPNLFHEDYILQKPLYQSHFLKTDINIASDIILKTIRENSDKISGIYIVGESLGSFVAVVVSSSLIKSFEFKRLYKKSLLLSALLDLPLAVDNIDKRIKENSHYWKNCYRILLFPQYVYQFIYLDRPSRYSTHFKKCMNAQMFNGIFLKKANDALEYLNPELNKVKTMMSFFKSFNHTLYGMIKARDSKLKISTWLKEHPQKETFYIISSRDDFVNAGISWEEFKRDVAITHENLMILDWGAHSTLLSFQGFSKIFSRFIQDH
jgi:hypothetical protein